MTLQKIEAQNKKLESILALHKGKSFDYSSIPHDFEKFNKYIGLPKHPESLEERPLTPAQLDFIKSYTTKDVDWIHLNKARQCGWTELILRILAYNAFFKYKGKKIGIIAGTSGITTKQIFDRFRELFANIPETVNENGPLKITLHNGTEIYGAKASVEAFTGWTKFGAFLMDESAKWDRIDDTPVLDSILPIARSNHADVFMISTPNGPRGFFYHIGINENSEFKHAEYNIHKGGKGLYTKEEIQQMINSSEEDPNQEYLCQYTIGRESIWGNLEEDDYDGVEEYSL